MPSLTTRREVPNEPEEPTGSQPPSPPPVDPGRPTGLTGWMRRLSPRQRTIAVWVALAALVLGCAYLASAPGSDAPAANGPDTGSEFAAIERFVQDEMAAQRIPGLALGIVKDD